MAAITLIIFFALCFCIVFLVYTNRKAMEKHVQKVQLLEEIIIALSANKVTLRSELHLSEELDEAIKSRKIKLMNDINDLQHELFAILSKKNN